jgi:hypothetical protein
MITNELKQKIIEKLASRRALFTGSDAKYATSLGINAAQYSRIKNGDTEKVISEAQWMSSARRLGIGTDGAVEWKTVNTPVFQFITAQLELCRERSLSAILCDRSDIGKTFVAKQFVKSHRNAVYIDVKRLQVHRSPGVVVIDSIRFREMDFKVYKRLKEQFPGKVFIYVSHIEGGVPQGATARRVWRDASVAFRVERFKAFPVGRFGGGEPVVISGERAEELHRMQ